MKARCSTGGRMAEHLGKGRSRLARLRITQLKETIHLKKAVRTKMATAECQPSYN
jgi:hypothetical protein